MKLFKLNTNVAVGARYILTNKRLIHFQILFNLIGSFVGIFFLISIWRTFTLISLFWLIVIILFLVVSNVYYTKLKKLLFMSLYIRENLLYVLTSNNLYEMTTTHKGKNVVISSGKFNWFIHEQTIEIRACITGDRYSKKMCDLKIHLQGALSPLYFNEQVPHSSYMAYYFLTEKKEIEQYVFNNSRKLERSFFDDCGIGIIRLNNSHSIRLKNNNAIGIFGRTGSGKTIALQFYLFNAVAKGAGTIGQSHLYIVDGKGADLFALGTILKTELDPENVEVGETPHDLARLLRQYVQLMEERFQQIQNNDSFNNDSYDLEITPNFFFIDELASIRDSCGSDKKGKELWNEILQRLGLIARKGRQAGCHLVIATQDPNADNIPVEIRNQITCVNYLGNPSKERIKMAFAMCDLEDVPTISDRKGEALFYADGIGLNKPEITIIPFVDIQSKNDFVATIKRIKPY